MLRVNTKPRRKNAPRIAEKSCRVCGCSFTKPAKISWAQWDARESCSHRCGRTVPLKDRILARLKVRGADDCWVWKNAPNRHGYGQLTVRDNGRQVNRLAHRLAYLAFNGVDPGEMLVLHSCDNRACCNPAHLRLGTHDDNMDDRTARGRNNPPKGEAHGQAKLNDRAVREIRSSRIPRRILAQRYGVSPSLIGCVRLGTIWKHVV